LEIGCGTGEFLSSILNNKDIVIKGTDFNDEVVRICKRKGLDVENIDIEDIKSESYDYIVAFQVLEHLNDVNHFFSECKRILKPSGKIIIGVPNCKSFVFSPFSDFYFEHGSLILNLPPHHMNWWTKKSLMLAGKNHGFKLNKCYFEPLPDFRKTLVDNNLRALIKIKVIHRIFRKLLYKRYNSIFKGETILVVLEKQENV
jgi:2-polyprenyl-3-methyl-5-hydroxy-6-metoxy-1,4-benzoquinol methylase